MVWGKMKAEVCWIFCYLFYITKISRYWGRKVLPKKSLTSFSFFSRVWRFQHVVIIAQSIHILCSNVARFKKKILLSSRIGNFVTQIIEGRGFRGGSGEIIRRMWLWREIVVAGLPPLIGQTGPDLTLSAHAKHK